MLAITSLLLASAAVVRAISVDTYASGADYPFVVHNPGGSGKQAAFIFLHGSGSCGSDLNSNVYWDGLGKLMQSSSAAATIAQDDLIAILPLHPECNTAVREWVPSKVQSVIDLAKQKYSIDDDQLYCGGYSMGGKGTWTLAMSNPQLCKKLVVSAGYTQISSSLSALDSTDLAPLKNIPMQLFAGTSDDKQPASTTAGPVVTLLKSLGASSITYKTFDTDHSGMSHIPWESEDLWKWVVAAPSGSKSSDSDSDSSASSDAAKPSSTTKVAAVKANAIQTSQASSSTTKTQNPKCKAGSSSSSRRRRQRRALKASHVDRRHLAPRHPGQPRKFDYGGPHGGPIA